MHHLWVEFLHVLGVDNVSGEWYGFWSGFGGDLTLIASVLAAPIILWRKHDCDARRCPRLARHDFKDPETGTVQHLCRKHHPEESRKAPTGKQIQERYHLYLGKHPGKG